MCIASKLCNLSHVIETKTVLRCCSPSATPKLVALPCKFTAEIALLKFRGEVCISKVSTRSAATAQSIPRSLAWEKRWTMRGHQEGSEKIRGEGLPTRNGKTVPAKRSTMGEHRALQDPKCLQKCRAFLFPIAYRNRVSGETRGRARPQHLQHCLPPALHQCMANIRGTSDIVALDVDVVMFVFDKPRDHQGQPSKHGEKTTQSSS